MFNSSLRRVARATPNGSLSTIRNAPPHTHTTAITASFTTRSHQRRNSSSKPPIPPNNGAPPIPQASVKQVGAPRSDKADQRMSKDKSKTNKSRGVKVEAVGEKEKAKEDLLASEWTKGLPSVPSTQHLNPKDIYVASFFSTHRPISITGPLPPETPLSEIDKIFTVRPSKTPRRKPQDVIYTISSVVQSIESQAAAADQQQQAAAQHEEGVTARADIIKALTQGNHSITNTNSGDTHHLDGQPGQQQQQTGLRVPGNVKLVIQNLARQFRPFHVPPVPVPSPEVEFFEPEKADQEATTTSEIAAQQQTQTQIQPQTQTQTHPQPEPAAEPTNSFFTPTPIPSTTYTTSGRTVRGVSHARQNIRIQDALRREQMRTISVKRQRRLKMKKHKYKKLQRKTRNLRRRQGKI